MNVVEQAMFAASALAKARCTPKARSSVCESWIGLFLNDHVLDVGGPAFGFRTLRASRQSHLFFARSTSDLSRHGNAHYTAIPVTAFTPQHGLTTTYSMHDHEYAPRPSSPSCMLSDTDFRRNGESRGRERMGFYAHVQRRWPRRGIAVGDCTNNLVGPFGLQLFMNTGVCLEIREGQECVHGCRLVDFSD